MSSCCKFLRINGYTMAMRGFHEIVLPSRARSCFLCIVFVRRKTPDVTDDHTKKRRSRHDQTRCLQDGLTKGKMDSRIQYENAPSRGLPGFFLTCQRFCAAQEVAAGARESPPETIRQLKMPSRMARCFHDQSRM